MKFIHTADIHLGAEPDRGYSWSGERKQEIWDSFRRLIALAGREQTDLLLIAGDLFHRQPLKSELREVNYLFSTIPDTEIVLAAGNHDYLREDSYYRNFPWNKNVHFFMGRQVEQLYLKRIDVTVYGCSYHSREIFEGIYDDCVPEEGAGIHILMAHGGDEKHVPISFSKLAGAGFDYVALGHIHRPRIVAENKMAYSGGLEPIDRNDFGKHGFIRGEIDRGNVRIRFQPFACRNYILLELRTDSETTQIRLEEILKEEIDRQGKQNIYVLSLVGTRERDMKFELSRLYRLGNIVYAEDLTEPELDSVLLRRQYRGTVIEEYIKQFPDDAGGCELLALHYGLEALLQTKR